MKKYKKNNNETAVVEPVETNENEIEKIDVNSIQVVVERIEGGLIGTLRIEDDINKPIIKKGDHVNLRTPSKLSIKDFVLYKFNEEYFLRRILKFKEDGIYVAADTEKEYRVIAKEDIIARVISRERKKKVLSFSLTPKNRLYTFRKVNMQYLRLRDRVVDYEREAISESLELAKTSLEETKTTYENVTYNSDIDLDSDLQSFLNPDQLVLELRGLVNTPQEEEEVEEILVDEDGNPIEEVVYVDEDGNVIENHEEVEYVEEIVEEIEE